MTERYREGWTWVEVGESGYWSKLNSKAKHSHKLDFFCPHCKKITGSGGIDDKALREHGVCAECVVMHIESRAVPTIDVEKYKPKH